MQSLLCRIIVTALVVLGLFSTSVHAYFMTLDANDEQCFFDKLKTGTKMEILYEVAEGGFLDIGFRVIGPDRRVLRNTERESSGKFAFTAHVDGVYTYCFSNKMSSMTPKTVLFMSYVGAAPGSAPAHDYEDADDEHKRLTLMVDELDGRLASVKREQDILSVRERVHRNINESTNRHVVLWAAFEAFLLVAMAAGQVYYLKRFFEVRSVL